MAFSFLDDPVDSKVKRCYLKQGMRFLGYVKKTAGGYTFRRSEDDAWAAAPCLSREAAAEFLQLVGPTV